MHDMYQKVARLLLEVMENKIPQGTQQQKITILFLCFWLLLFPGTFPLIQLLVILSSALGAKECMCKSDIYDF